MKLEDFLKDADDKFCEYATNIVVALFVVGFIATVILIWGIE